MRQADLVGAHCRVSGIASRAFQFAYIFFECIFVDFGYDRFLHK